MHFFDFLGLIIVFGSVLFLAYITTKYVGKNAARTMKGKNLEVVEVLKLGVDKQLYIVRAGDKFLLMASTGRNIQLVSEINLDETNIAESTVQEPGVYDFKAILEKYISSFKPQQGFLGKKTMPQKKKDMNQNNFVENIKKLQNINDKIDSEETGHENK